MSTHGAQCNACEIGRPRKLPFGHLRRDGVELIAAGDDDLVRRDHRGLAHAAGQHCVVSLLDQRQTTDAGADANTNLLAIFPLKIETGILQRINRGGNAIVNKGIEAAGLLRR